jgi:hypothetical protein
MSSFGVRSAVVDFVAPVHPGPTWFNRPQLDDRIRLKYKYLKMGYFCDVSESVLETVDRFFVCSLFSDTYKIDHLPKQQVVYSDEAHQHWSWHTRLVATGGSRHPQY